MTDTIKFRCKACEKKIGVRAEYAGKRVKCPGCKQPLRVPSPRPKRSATGVPVAAGVSEDPSGLSGGMSSDISLAELAAMEENATAELKELSSKAVAQPANLRVPGGKECPSCAASLKPDAVICVHCGHNYESGKQLKTKKDSKIGKAFSAVQDAAAGDDHGSDYDMWKYAGPTCALVGMALLCFTGLAGTITEGIPWEKAESLNNTYHSMGQVGSGLFFSALAGVSGGIWWYVHRR
ncbi:MAG: hypothetical protein ACPGYV_01925 [Phycisphaeraceae bacterium]